MPSYFPLLALLILGVVEVTSHIRVGRSFLRSHRKTVFLTPVVILLGMSFYFSWRQYLLWSAGSLTQFFLPPYQDIGYFAFYSLTRFFAPYLISLVFALLILWIAIIFNKKSGGIFFEKEEPYLAAISLFLVGHPGWLIYLVALISVYFILHTLNLALRREATRLPLYHLWAPTAFFVILINEYWLSSTHWWQLLSF